MSIESKVDAYKNDLALFDDDMAKYEYIIELGKNLPPLDTIYKSDENKVLGCQSQVWLRAYEKDGLLYFQADSDALIVKGLVSIITSIYSGESAKSIRESDTSLLKGLGLNEIISTGRQNGVASMLKRVFAYAKDNHE